MESKLLVLLLVVALLLGCAQQQPPAQPPATPSQPGGTPQPPGETPPQINETPPQPPGETPPQINETPPSGETPSQPTTVDLGQIYKYESVHNYEYRVTSAGATFNMRTSLSSDTVDNVEAWLQQTDITTEGATVTSKVWLDKQTYKCLKAISVIRYGGQTIEQPGQCPTTGINSASQTETPKLTYVGKETVTVPAGTFLCDKYTFEATTFWATSNIPLPVKVADTSSVMELVSYG